jgi:hypothetical protein
MNCAKARPSRFKHSPLRQQVTFELKLLLRAAGSWRKRDNRHDRQSCNREGTRSNHRDFVFLSC